MLLSQLMRLLPILLAVSYPFLAHAAVARNSDLLAVTSIAVLAVLVIWPGLRAGRLWAWLAVPVIASVLILLARAHLPWLPLYAPPVLINLGLAWLFGSTLRAAQVPLIERLVRLLHEPAEMLDPQIPRYARRLTLAWTLLFCAMALLNLWLALCVIPSGILDLLGIQPPIAVSRSTWSLFTNLLNYLIAGGFFLGEYFYRQRRFPQQPYRNFLDFVRRSAAVGHLAMRPPRP